MITYSRVDISIHKKRAIEFQVAIAPTYSPSIRENKSYDENWGGHIFLSLFLSFPWQIEK